MAISIGDRLPEGTLFKMGDKGPEAVEVGALTKGRKVVLFGLPAAFSGTCTSAHLPSFMRTREAFGDKGVDDVVCVSVNDAFTMGAWDKQMGATDSGIAMLGDASGAFTKAMGMDFDLAAAGLFGRSKRYAMYVEDGVVRQLNVEEQAGVCELSAGETLLDQL
ncbi:peroxiredoxin [Rhodobacteraceae bacterium LMO-12]|nr:peroxiredoxin [Rhodobacteraceae bacterium LMO-JJ12]